MRRYRRRLLALVLPALVLAGCGGGTAPGPYADGGKVVVKGQSATGSEHPAGWGKPAPSKVWRLNPESSQATLVMYDAVDLSQVPSNPLAVAGYTSGNWPTYLQIHRNWPNTHAVSIAISYAYHADCLDIEPGDAVPSVSALRTWVQTDIIAGFKHPCLYSSYYEYRDQVIPDLQAGGISLSSVIKWDADYHGCNGVIDSGFDGTQCTDKAFGRNLDESLVTPYFLSMAQPPYGVTPPPPPKVVCWGKGATPTSSACKSIEAQAHKLWVTYLAYHNAIPGHTKELNHVKGVIAAEQSARASVYQVYKGPGEGWLSHQLWAENKYGGQALAAKNSLVRSHTG